MVRISSRRISIPPAEEPIPDPLPSWRPGDLRVGSTGSGEQVALEQVATEIDQSFALMDRLDPLRDDHHSQVLAERDERADQLLLDALQVDAAHERDVDLDHVRGQLGEVVEAGVARAQVVD